MSNHIKEMIQKCETCRLQAPEQVEPLCPSTLPEQSWERIGADLFHFQNKTYLLVVDYYSRWIEVRKLSSAGSHTTIEAMKSIFSVHGICELLVSDNGPQFASQEFHDFVSQYGFSHVTSSPAYPKANGEAERAVGTVKRLWKKTADPHLSLMIYRATPLENGYTPSELLMGRQIRTTLPTLPSNLLPNQPRREDIIDQEERQRQQTSQNHDYRHRARTLPELDPRSRVFIRDMAKEAVVIEKTAPRSYKVQTPTGVIRRNRSALIKLEDMGERNGAEGTGQCQRTNYASQTTHSPGIRSAEGTGQRHTTNPASPSTQVLGGIVAEGTGQCQTTPARQLPSGSVYSRPQRSKRKPEYLETYNLS